MSAESGIIVTSENILIDPHGTPYAKLYVYTTAFIFLFRG
jgi:hypothetical protein